MLSENIQVLIYQKQYVNIEVTDIPLIMNSDKKRSTEKKASCYYFWHCRT